MCSYKNRHYEKNYKVMIITGTIIAGCIYVFSQEVNEKRDKNINTIAKKLTSKKASNVIKKSTLKQQIQNVLSPFSENQIVHSLNQEEAAENKSEEEKAIDKRILAAKITLGVSVASWLVAPQLKLLAFAGLTISSVGYYEDAYKSLKKNKGKVKCEVLQAVSVTAILLSGYITLAAIDAVVYYYSKKFLLRTEDRTIRKLVNLFGEQTKFVWLVKDHLEVEIPFEKLKKGSIISIRSGEMIPIDGEIVKGDALINQLALTGESQPVEKKIGDTCFASTVVLEGNIHIKVTKAGAETAAAQIGEILNQSIDYREVMISKGQKMADKTALPMIGLSAASIPLIGLAGAGAVSASSNIYLLTLTSPILALNFLSIASHEGILIKDGRVLEKINQIDTVVFDKTGTLTLPQPHVGKIHALNGKSEEELLTYAATAEYRQTHPIAAAIIKEAEKRQLNLPEIDESKYNIGYGITVKIGGKIIQVGSGRFMDMENIIVPEQIQTLTKEGYQKGYSFVYISIDKQLQGIFELHATVRPEVKAIIRELQAKNKECYIISGDHEQPTRNLAKQLGIKQYFAEVLPEDKARLITELQQKDKKVCFIGDGINDSIALKKADLSISLRGASTIATDTAQVVLMTETLNQLPLLFQLGAQFDEHMKTTLRIWMGAGSISIGGALFFGAGIWTSLVISQIALTLSVCNAIDPALTYEQAKNRKIELQKNTKKRTKIPKLKSIKNKAKIKRLSSGYIA